MRLPAFLTGRPLILALALLPALAAAATVTGVARVSAVDAVFEDLAASPGPGCAVGVVRDGVLVHAVGYGYANLEYWLPLTADSVFRTGSLSKQFTAAAVLVAADEGLLSLDDPLGRYLPELHPSVAAVTLAEVVGHTGGLPDYDADELNETLRSSAGGPFRFGGEDYLTTPEFYHATTRITAVAPAGESFSYSNIGYFWLAQVLERATGTRLREFAARRLFGPAGMNHSQFNDDADRIVPGRASGYAPHPDGGFTISETNLDWVGEGGVYTSVNDFYLWDRQLYRPTIGPDPERLRDRRLEPLVATGDGGEYAAGLEWQTGSTGERFVGHGGAWVAFRSAYRRYPGRDLAYYALCNRPDADLEARMDALETVLLTD